MALTREQLEAIIRGTMPSYRRSQRQRTGADTPYSTPEAGTPDMKTLRRKFLGNLDAAGADDEDVAELQESDTTMVVAEPEEGANPSDPATAEKVLIISKSTGKVTGSQG